METTLSSKTAGIANLSSVSFEQILESAPDAMLIINAEGEIVYVNSLSASLFGYAKDELVGEAVELLVPQHARTAHVSHRQGFFEQPRVRRMETGLELYGRRRDGTQFPIEISLSPLATEGGTLVLGAVRDRTKNQRAEMEIRDLNRKLQAKVVETERANRELQEFTYTTAHDLRAPVRHMQGYAEMLRQSAKGRLSNSEVVNVDKLIKSAKRLGLLIDGLLEFARIGRIILRPTRFDLGPMLTETQAALAEGNPGRAIRWLNHSTPRLVGDPALLRVVLFHLLDNALKFTRVQAEAVIETGATLRDGAIIVSVRDNGVGFEMQYASRLFQVFQRLHRHEEFEGTGIGLATMRRIIERHNGKVWAESELGRGSTFYFSIPQGGYANDVEYSPDSSGGGRHQ